MFEQRMKVAVLSAFIIVGFARTDEVAALKAIENVGGRINERRKATRAASHWHRSQ
jgi:hypothetical protein